MRGRREPQHGDGTVWLVADRAKGDYLCYWYTGPNDDRLIERGREPTASTAVAWGRVRSSRVRIRRSDARTYWAGTAPRPDGFTLDWVA